MLILGTYREVDGAGQQALEATLRELIRERLADELHLEPLQVEARRVQAAAERLVDELGKDASRPQLLRAKGRLRTRRDRRADRA